MVAIMGDADAGDRKLRTKFALRALDLGDVFNATMADYVVAGRPNRRVTLSVPEGQSTAGGTQANQSISLVADDPHHSILVAGTVNPVMLTAELRGYPYLSETHRLRFHKPFDIAEGVYLKFLEKVEGLLKLNGFTVTVINQLPQATRQRLAARHPSQSSSSAFWVILLFLVLAGGGVAAWLLLNP